jgi:hypothetical protein
MATLTKQEALDLFTPIKERGQEIYDTINAYESDTMEADEMLGVAQAFADMANDAVSIIQDYIDANPVQTEDEVTNGTE